MTETTMEDEPDKESYIVEFVRIGTALKVIAIDPVSLREVSMIGNPRLSRKHLAKKAVEKLKYVIEKDA